MEEDVKPKKSKKSKKKMIKTIAIPAVSFLFIIIIIMAPIILAKEAFEKGWNAIIRVLALISTADKDKFFTQEARELIARVLDEKEPIENFSAAELSYIYSNLSLILGNSSVDDAKSIANTGAFVPEDFVKILDTVAQYENSADIYNFWYETDYLRTLTDEEIMQAYTEAYNELSSKIEAYHIPMDADFEIQYNYLIDIHEMYEDNISDPEGIHEVNYETIIELTKWWSEQSEYLHFDPIGTYIINHDWIELKDEDDNLLYPQNSYSMFMEHGSLGNLFGTHYFNEYISLTSTGDMYEPYNPDKSPVFVPLGTDFPDDDNYVYTYSYPMKASVKKTSVSYYRDLYYPYGVTWQYVYAACAVYAMQNGMIYEEPTTVAETTTTGSSEPTEETTEETTTVEETTTQSSKKNSGLHYKLDEDFLIACCEKLCGSQDLKTYTKNNLGNGIEDIRSRMNQENTYGSDWFVNYEKRKDNPLSFMRTAYYTHSGSTQIYDIGGGYCSVRDVTPTYALETFTTELVEITTTCSNDEKTIAMKVDYKGGDVLVDDLKELFDSFDTKFQMGQYTLSVQNLPGGAELQAKLTSAPSVTEYSVDDKTFTEVYYAVDLPTQGFGDTYYGYERPKFAMNVVVPTQGQYIPNMDNVYFFECSAGNTMGQTAYCEDKDKRDMEKYFFKTYKTRPTNWTSFREIYNKTKNFMSTNLYFQEHIPCNNRIASTCSPYVAYNDGSNLTEYPAYMRSLSESEITAIMDRTGLVDSTNIDAAYMYTVLNTALHAVGKIQYASEYQRNKNNNNNPTSYDDNGFFFLDASWEDSLDSPDLYGSYEDWKSDPTGMFKMLQDTHYFGALTYPRAAYSTTLLDEFVWSDDDIKYNPNVIPKATNSNYDPIYDCSDMGFILWLYYMAGRDAMEYNYNYCSTVTFFNTLMDNRIANSDAYDYADIQQDIFKHVDFMGRYSDIINKTNYTYIDNQTASDWCIGDIIIEVKKPDASQNSMATNQGNPFITEDGEANYHAFIYVGPTNNQYTEVAIIENIGDPSHYADYHGDPNLQGGVAYSVIDLKGEIDDGAVFYRYQVTLNSNDSEFFKTGKGENGGIYIPGYNNKINGTIVKITLNTLKTNLAAQGVTTTDAIINDLTSSASYSHENNNNVIDYIKLKLDDATKIIKDKTSLSDAQITQIINASRE